MRAADLLGITIAGLIMAAIGGAVALTVDDDGLATVGLVIAGFGCTATLFGLLALAIFAGVKAGRTD